MSPELLAHQLEQEQPSANVIDVNNPEQVAYLLPFSNIGDQNKQELFVAINPRAASVEEMDELMISLEKGLRKDFRALGIETEQATSPMVFADESGILDYLEGPETEDKIAKMMNKEIPGEIHGMRAVKMKGDKEVMSNPLLAEATAALIGRQLEQRGRSEDAWLEDLTNESPNSVCIKAGEYSLPQAITKEHSIQNLDKCIREEAFAWIENNPDDATSEQATDLEDIVEQDTQTYEAVAKEAGKGFLGNIATRAYLRFPRIAH